MCLGGDGWSVPRIVHRLRSVSFILFYFSYLVYLDRDGVVGAS